jgi:glycosyltransferase involved in cell wall biosynthesis
MPDLEARMHHQLVSIVTPSYNQKAYVQATIDSVLQQSYSHLESIVMDGGSSDGTVEVLQGNRDPRLVWYSEPDRGQAHAINKGMQLSQGDVLSYLNSDDLLHPNAIQTAVDYLERNPDVDMVYGDCNFIDADGKILRVVRAAPFRLVDAIRGAQRLVQPGTFWRRTVYEKVGNFDESLHYVMDFDYWIRAALLDCKIAYIPKTLASFRLHSQSKTVSQQQRFLDDWHTILGKLPVISAELNDAKQKALTYLQWRKVKLVWERDRIQARDDLWAFIRSGGTTRRVLAATMLLDSYVNTQVTITLAKVFKQLTQEELF